jgi:hypothetical protein
MIIEACGTGGTALGKFTRRIDVARGYWDSEHRVITLWSVRTGEELASIDIGYMSVSDGYSGAYEGRADSFAAALALALGRPPYGHTWYQVKGHSRTYDPTVKG